MKRELVITSDPIDEAALTRARTVTSDMGAVIAFLGFVRGTEEDQPIKGIRYEAFARMAEHQFGAIFDAVEARWQVASIRLVHRLGFVAVGEPSLWVEIVTPHRGEGFAACQYLIDEMKRLVPIWKHAEPGFVPHEGQRPSY
jgi:molybdopterin synthase catalytic subunit